MVKKKKGKKGNEEFFEKLVESKSDGWHTGPVSAMNIDDDVGGTDPNAGGAQKATQSVTDDMKVDKPKKMALGVATTSMKRGQRTRNQRKRKVASLEKAMARTDKITSKADGMKNKRQSKLSLKHMY
mmetsp:Transcript_9462/g.20163  ORF Transcript_9462/g.20163 Transcript_9462/m.20163 type:complete len:127 (+) Transcript_9462:59-439(+)|eukprot:CAMPEP_0202891206 /NCGR_PEP_ID=MMETSP1392-20130828/1326_1 /ASSEMBLY_ACC=CAM_ASM_000868 /TAXON_ID=225041 /ORGANISM="Chlamydomonas chlamydogama, Strain SAG 11-48b" /LENGTH=126 /DNA_ID=CAMNT_0049574891 /DNA_START=34 /DNA_END=414 /DNA_ORIENTATION=-